MGNISNWKEAGKLSHFNSRYKGVFVYGNLWRRMVTCRLYCCWRKNQWIILYNTSAVLYQDDITIYVSQKFTNNKLLKNMRNNITKIYLTKIKFYIFSLNKFLSELIISFCYINQDELCNNIACVIYNNRKKHDLHKNSSSSFDLLFK